MLDERDQKLLDALVRIAEEIRVLRMTLLSAIAPASRDEEGVKTREGFVRTEEMSDAKGKTS